MNMLEAPPALLLRWQDNGGQRFAGWFFSARQSGKGLAPLFITYYSCGGFLRGGVGYEWPPVSLAQAGISALCIDRRPGFTMGVGALRRRYGRGGKRDRSAGPTGRDRPRTRGHGWLEFRRRGDEVDARPLVAARRRLGRQPGAVAAVRADG